MERMNDSTPHRRIGADGRRRPGPAPRLSLDKIVDAALGENFSTLSIPALAQKLGVSHAAIYRYLDGAQGLRLACLNEIGRRMEWPTGATSWDGLLRDLARVTWDTARRYPGFALCLATTPGGPAMAAAPLERLHGELLGFGLTPQQAMVAMDSVGDAMLISAIETEMFTPSADLPDPAETHSELWRSSAETDLMVFQESWQDGTHAREKVELLIAGLRARYSLT